MAGSSRTLLPWDPRLCVALDTFRDLMEDGVFETRFPLHQVRGRVAGRGPALGAGLGAGHSLWVACAQGEEELEAKWARWRNLFRKQPIDDIR